MKLKKVEVVNFRLLKDLCGDKQINIDKETTVLVGKNNSGKTSFSYLFEIFMKKKGEFSFEDFSVQCYEEFERMYQEYISLPSDENEVAEFFVKAREVMPSIQLNLVIEYGKEDNWSRIRPLLTSLDDNNELKIIFKYSIHNLKKFFIELKKQYLKKKKQENVVDIVRKIYDNHFKTTIYPYSPYNEYEEISMADINQIIGSCFIAAQRNVDDSNSSSNSKLSNIFQKEYKTYKRQNSGEDDTKIEQLENALDKANRGIDVQLRDFFKDFTNSFSTFGYPNIEGTEVVLKSSVTSTNMFNGIGLFYKNSEHLLPEKYNGLGYSNLIYIISEIMTFKSKLMEEPTDLNLIFIEEPEAHMHPQLQNTFISKLNVFLEENGINAQVIITTHSSHIIANGNFENIRYFCKTNQQTNIKDLMDFNPGQCKDNVQIINFLKQYMNLVKCDMFFADKIVLIEGTCERLLMPIFINKVDQVLKKKKNLRPLSEQYIAIIEIGGAYMLKFKEFLEFLEIKTLIITDIDSCIVEIQKDDNGNIKKNQDGTDKKKIKKTEIKKSSIDKLITTNPTICKWIPQETKIEQLIKKKNKDLVDGKIAIAYQRQRKGGKPNILKCGRTFEEAFIIDNIEYIYSNKEFVESIKNKLKNYKSSEEILQDSYVIYEYIDVNSKKTEFAFDLMYVNQEAWNVPGYIEEGLKWLAEE